MPPPKNLDPQENQKLLSVVVEEVDEAREVYELARQLAHALPLHSFADVAKAVGQDGTITFRGNPRQVQNFQKVLENFEIAISAFASQDKVLAEKLLRHKHHGNEFERDLRNRHFHRLHAGLTESFETSAIHLDVLTNLKRINSHLTGVAYPILENGRVN